MAVEHYRFIASGQGDVVSAFKSIGRAAADSKAQVEKAFENVPRVAAKSAGRTVNVEERAMQRRVAILHRAEVARQARINKAAEAEIRALEKKFAREAALEEKAAARSIALAQRTAARERALAERNAKEAAAARSHRISGAIRGAGSFALRSATGIALAGAAVTGLALRESMQLDERARRVAIQGSTLTNREDPTALRKHFENVALSVPGAKAEGVAVGTERFMAKTGDLDAAKRFSKTWAETAMATSASIEDIADASADLMQKFDIKKTEDMGKALSVLAVQGKRGAFELKDAASQYPRIAAAAQRFGLGKGVGALATLGGLTQIARSATGSSEEASTSVERLFSNMGVKAGKIKATTGVDVWKGDFKENLVNIIGKTGGNDYGKKYSGLSDIFGERGIRAISPLMSAFNDAVKQGKDGMQAMRDKLAEATDATGADAEVKKDMATAQESAGAKLTAAWESIKASLGEATPKIAEFVGKLADFAGNFDAGPIVDLLSDSVDILKRIAEFFGAYKEKELTPEQATEKHIADAEKDVQRHANERQQLLDKAGRTGTLNALDQKRLDQLNNEVTLPTEIRARAEAKRRKDDKTANQLISAEEFAKQYANAGNDPTLAGSAGMIADYIKRHPFDNEGMLDPNGKGGHFSGIENETDQQKLLRRALKHTVTTATGQGADSAAARAALGNPDKAPAMAKVEDIHGNKLSEAAVDQKAAAKALTDAASALKKVLPQSHFALADIFG